MRLPFHSGDETGPAPPENLRVLRVAQVQSLTPSMRRIIFQGEDLARYDRPDQLDCRLIFQPKGVVSPQWPVLDDRGHVVGPPQQKLPTHVYTIRRIDAALDEITIDFALHDRPGPATRWALDAARSNIAGILGPAANGAKPADFYVLAGDEERASRHLRACSNISRRMRAAWPSSTSTARPNNCR